MSTRYSPSEARAAQRTVETLGRPCHPHRYCSRWREASALSRRRLSPSIARGHPVLSVRHCGCSEERKDVENLVKLGSEMACQYLNIDLAIYKLLISLSTLVILNISLTTNVI